MVPNSPISVIIPTIGRESLIRAIESVLEQEVPGRGIEVIVVNDSGGELIMPLDVFNDPRVAVITTNRRGQSTARNAGAAKARGSYLLFLDDDDWLAQDALAVLVGVLQLAPSAVVAYGAVNLVDSRGGQLGRLNLGLSGNCAAQVLAGATIQVGSALIEAGTFFAAGGFNTLLPNGDEESLFRRVSQLGGFANSSEVVVNVLRGDGWQSSVEQARPALESVRTSREQMLDQPRVFGRVLQSATTPYWRARIVKAFAASAYWNLKHRRPLRTLSRLVYLFLAMIITIPSVAHREFWQGLADTHVPATFQRSLEGKAKMGEGVPTT